MSDEKILKFRRSVLKILSKTTVPVDKVLEDTILFKNKEIESYLRLLGGKHESSFEDLRISILDLFKPEERTDEKVTALVDKILQIPLNNEQQILFLAMTYDVRLGQLAPEIFKLIRSKVIEN